MAYDGGLTFKRTRAFVYEKAGYGPMPPRDPAHAPVNWYETDYDDQFTDPDTEPNDPLPTLRHRQVP